MKINDFNFMIGGKAGEGVDLPGSLFGRLCMHAGLRVHSTAEFYSVIKGYNNIYQVRTAEDQVYAHSGESNWETQSTSLVFFPDNNSKEPFVLAPEIKRLDLVNIKQNNGTFYRLVKFLMDLCFNKRIKINDKAVGKLVKYAETNDLDNITELNLDKLY